MEIHTVRQRLADIDAALDNGRYKGGMWQRLLREAQALSPEDKRAIAGQLSAVSRKLHGRNHYPSVPFAVGFAGEILLFGLGVGLVGVPSVPAILAGVAALALSLQPTIKLIAGLLLGVRYDYAFLWYVEPRFKMRYGSYFQLSPARKVVFHLAGSIGTPLAMLVGYLVFSPIDVLLSNVCLVLAIGALAMQVGAFIAQWMGIDRVAGFQLATLTSPATAAFELKQVLTQRRG